MSPLERLEAFVSWSKREQMLPYSEGRLLLAQDIEKLLELHTAAFEVNRLHSAGGSLTRKAVWFSALDHWLREIEASQEEK